ncbi:TPA: hypothetical protein SAY52_005790 [Burkholderia cenocepacia]|uniref:hypothetical protein n=1 Tax=unclassified Burkholderia TaxID=2613784 RepID=UPI00158ACD8F|nr:MULTISPECIES: hypothetical protein [unclassified Burkholderia]HEF5875098.1 hypothetical protein [Burkholderia cenocepacia]
MFWDALKAQALSLLDGTPKLVPLDGRAAQRAGNNASFLWFMETQGAQPLGGLMTNAAMQATGNAGYAVADTAGPLDALWAPGRARAASVANVRRSQLGNVGPVTREAIVSSLGKSCNPI